MDNDKGYPKCVDEIEDVNDEIECVNNKFYKNKTFDETVNFKIQDNDCFNPKFTDKILKCNVCELIFDNEDELEEHILEMNVEEEEEFDYDNSDDMYEHFIEPEIIKLLQKHGIDDTNISWNDKSVVDFDDSFLLLTYDKPTEVLVEDSFSCFGSLAAL